MSETAGAYREAEAPAQPEAVPGGGRRTHARGMTAEERRAAMVMAHQGLEPEEIVERLGVPHKAQSVARWLSSVGVNRAERDRLRRQILHEHEAKTRAAREAGADQLQGLPVFAEQAVLPVESEPDPRQPGPATEPEEPSVRERNELNARMILHLMRDVMEVLYDLLDEAEGESKKLTLCYSIAGASGVLHHLTKAYEHGVITHGLLCAQAKQE